MKYVILLGDGMSDWPVAELGDKTPLQAAYTPNMDKLARLGKTGQAQTIPEGMSTGSDVAALTILGYDARHLYTGRSPLEAASIGIALQPTDVAFRCNLVVLGGANGQLTMVDFSGGHITTEEARQLIESLNNALGSETFRFYPGVSYRHCLVWREGQLGMTLTPPHDITGRSIAEYLPSGDGATELQRLMDASQAIFRDHPTNRHRREHGEPPTAHKGPELVVVGRRETTENPKFSREIRLNRGGDLRCRSAQGTGDLCRFGADQRAWRHRVAGHQLCWQGRACARGPAE